MIHVIIVIVFWLLIICLLTIYIENIVKIIALTIALIISFFIFNYLIENFFYELSILGIIVISIALFFFCIDYIKLHFLKVFHFIFYRFSRNKKVIIPHESYSNNFNRSIVEPPKPKILYSDFIHLKGSNKSSLQFQLLNINNTSMGDDFISKYPFVCFNIPPIIRDSFISECSWFEKRKGYFPTETDQRAILISLGCKEE